MTRSDDDSEMDLQVMPVYAQGITGKGINVVVLDDGFEWRHPDIRDNYVSGRENTFNQNFNKSFFCKLWIFYFV